MKKYGYTCPKCGIYHTKEYNKKICSNENCQEPFINEAGELEQKNILFFGMPQSGKLSAMLTVANTLLEECCFLPLDPPDLENELKSFQEGTLPAKISSEPYSLTLFLQTTETRQFLLTLTSIPWDFQMTSSIFPHPSAYVLCWDMNTNFVHQQLEEEMEHLRQDLGRDTDLYKALYAFVQDEINNTLPPPISLKDCFSNLCLKVHQHQYRSSIKNSPPILLLYNKYDTIHNEEWRITPPENDPNAKKKMLWKEIQACKDDGYFPVLHKLSSIFTSTLDQKFFHSCFYAQLRFSPYGSHIPVLPLPGAMTSNQHVTRTIELFLRLYRYAVQYNCSSFIDSDKEKLMAAIEKYCNSKDFYNLPEEYVSAVKTAASSLLSSLETETLSTVDKNSSDSDKEKLKAAIEKYCNSKDFYNLPEEYVSAIKTVASSLFSSLGTDTLSKIDKNSVEKAHFRAERHAELADYWINDIPKHQRPAPQNADMLYQWLLYVSGILPVPLGDSQSDYHTLCAPEHRSKTAAQQFSNSITDDIKRKEILARFYLFENHRNDEGISDFKNQPK